MERVQAERIEILVLVDNVTDSLSTTPSFVTREWNMLRKRGMRMISGAGLCCANHGLALLITVHGPQGTRRVLFDGGPVDYAIARNGQKLGVDFGGIDAIVLSHGHWDHAGGLPSALRLMDEAGRRDVPLHLHPDMFHQRGSLQSDGGVLPMERVPAPEAWAAMGARPIVTRDAGTCLDGMVFVSGEIPRRTSYERGLPNQVRQQLDGSWTPDTVLEDERFIAVDIRDRGVVVFTACSHAGVVNVLHHARACFPGRPLFAVMGGFHLSGENESAIGATIADLGGFSLSHIIPAHCTGWRAVAALARNFGEPMVVPAAVGKHFSL